MSGGDGGPLLVARGLGRRRPDGEGWLLSGIDLELAPGDRVALSGPSGAGKTLLLRALALLDPSDAGDLLWRGEPVAADAVPEYRSRHVYLHQRPALGEGRVEAVLRGLFELERHREREFDRAAVEERLADLGRGPDLLDRDTADLSGGEAQIVALLRALAAEPEVLLLDEPTAALDPEAAAAIESLVDAWHGPGRAFLWVSHDRAQGARVAERRLEIRDGELVG